MSEQTCNAIIGDNVKVKINFDHQKAEPDVDLDESAEIEQVFVLNEGGYQIGDVIDVLKESELDRLQELCIVHMGDV